MNEPSRQNVIWIFGDQHPAHALSCHGNPNLNTPHIDRLATSGIDITSAVCGFPLCCPFRGSLLTGRYPHECVPGHEYPLDPATPTVAHAFKDAGYHTAYFGKWHLDGHHESDGRAALHTVTPERRGGFDEWLGYDNNNSQWDCWLHGHDHTGTEVPHYRLPGYETDCLANHLIEMIERRGGAENAEAAPFFAVLSVQPPHNPYLAPAEWMERHNPATVRFRQNVPQVASVREKAGRDLAGAYAMIENLDWNIGRIRSALAQAGLEEETHILFFSDHGDMHGSHGQYMKTTPYAESLSIPFIISGRRDRYDGHCGIVDTVPLNHVDIAPTTLGLCGIETPAGMRGTDYSFLRLPDRPRPTCPDSAYVQCVIPTGHGHSIDRPWRGVVTTDGWKYICLAGQPWLLFNLREDPFEEVNLAHNTICRAIRSRLNDRLRQWIHDTGDEFALPEL